MTLALFDRYTVYRVTVRLGLRTVIYQVRTTGDARAARALALRRARASAPAAQPRVLVLAVDQPAAGPDLPGRVRALRYRLGESRTVFGRRFGASPRTVEGWEQGRFPPRWRTWQYLQALEMEVLEAERADQDPGPRTPVPYPLEANRG
jgi:DNA-binding transcriptional regulator YiaG